MTAQSRIRALVVSDGKGISATQRISFDEPFLESGGAGSVDVTFENRLRQKSEIKASFRAADPDILVLSRYSAQNGQYWVHLAREVGIPAIFHIDDDLLAVPRSLGPEKYEAYNAPERLRDLRANMESCDLLYASTGPLAERLARHDVKVPIVAGSVYCSVANLDVGAFAPPATGPVIGYMGTGGHSQDLAMVLPAIEQLMRRIPALQFEVFGTLAMPKALRKFGNRVRHIPPVADYAAFQQRLRSLGWWVGLAPLEDNDFNRCKADTKWVEYSLAGMAVVASDMRVYHRACADGAGLLATTSEDWEAAIGGLLIDPAQRATMIAAASRRLRLLYSHAVLRKQIMAVFEQAREASAAGSAT